MKNRKGFTLVELLAVIVILGLLMAIAIPSVTRYITESRKKTLAASIQAYIDAVVTQVNDGEYRFSTKDIIYAVPIECIPLEKGGTNPFGEWIQSSDDYWAYVLVQYDTENYNYIYGFTFKDSAGYGMYPLTTTKMSSNGREIATDLFVSRPKTGMYTLVTSEDKWQESGFIINSDVRLNVLTARPYTIEGNGKTSCTLYRKGDNYDEVIKDINTDFANFESFNEEYVTETKNCTSYETCYGDNGGKLEYDDAGGIVLDNDNAIAVLTAEEIAQDITNEYSVQLTVGANTNQVPPGGNYAATMVALANKKSNQYLSWIGVYKNYLHVYSFSKTPYINKPTDYTAPGFTSIYIGDLSNKVFNIQVTGEKNGQTKVYINGELKRTFQSGGEAIVMEQLTIGDLRPYRNLKFKGIIYEVEINNRVLSANEIKNNYEHSKDAWGIR